MLVNINRRTAVTKLEYRAKMKALGLVNENTGAYSIEQSYEFGEEGISANGLEVLMTTFCIGLFEKVAKQLREEGASPAAMCHDLSSALYKVYCNIADNLEKALGIPIVKVKPPKDIDQIETLGTGLIEALGKIDQEVQIQTEEIENVLGKITTLGPPNFEAEEGLDLLEVFKKSNKIEDSEERLKALKEVLAKLRKLKKPEVH